MKLACPLTKMFGGGAGVDLDADNFVQRINRAQPPVPKKSEELIQVEGVVAARVVRGVALSAEVAEKPRDRRGRRHPTPCLPRAVGKALRNK